MINLINNFFSTDELREINNFIDTTKNNFEWRTSFAWDNNIKYGATTDDDGRFNIDEIEDGRYKISISFIGFEDYRDDVAIESGKSYKVDAVLEIQPIAMSRLEIISDASAPYQKLPGSATVMDMQTIKLVNPIGTQEMLEHIPGINGSVYTLSSALLLAN